MKKFVLLSLFNHSLVQFMRNLGVTLQYLNNYYLFLKNLLYGLKNFGICLKIFLLGLSYMANVTFQTMLKSSAFIIQKSNYPAGFFLVLKVVEKDACIEGSSENALQCSDPNNCAFVTKSFRFVQSLSV